MATTMPSSAAAAAVGLHSLITRSSLLSSCTNDTRGAAAVAAVFDSSSPGGSFSIGSPPSSFSFFTTSCNRSLTDGELFCRNAGLVDNLSASSSHDQVRFLAFSFFFNCRSSKVMSDQTCIPLQGNLLSMHGTRGFFSSEFGF